MNYVFSTHAQRARRRTQAFPILTPAQIDRIRPWAVCATSSMAKFCSSPMTPAFRFSCCFRATWRSCSLAWTGERPVATHGPGEFTGEITMISGQRSLVRGRVTVAGEFLELSGEALRTLVAQATRS